MKFVGSCGIVLVTLAAVTPGYAQVAYRHGDAARAHNPYTQPYDADEDMSYATHPSFQLFDTPRGPGIRVVNRCAYPNGWNATDFIRDQNGTPTGIGHTCPDPYETSGFRARY